MAYVRKTRDCFDVEGKYAHGWECVTGAETRKEARQHLKEYRANEPGTSFRLRVHREKIEAEPKAPILDLSDSQIEAEWDKGNNNGDGCAIGEETMSPLEAAEAEGLTDIRTFDTRTSTGHCAIAYDGNSWIAICDANGPWAVRITAGGSK